MAHPHRKAAAEASREKFKAITGHKGGGHAHAGSSHLKKPGDDGVQHVWSGHAKSHVEEHAHGSHSKRRGGKFARGGKVEGKAPREVNVNISLTPQGANSAPPPPPMPPPAPPPAGGAAPPPGGPPQSPPGGGANPMAALGKGLGGMARGGRALARGGRAGHRDTAKHAAEGDSSYDLAKWRDYAKKNTETKAQRRASGGRMTAGALSGEGRLEKAAIAKRRNG